MPIWFRVKRVGIHEGCWQLRGATWATASQGDHKVKGLDRKVAEDHESRQERGPQLRE